MKLKDKREVNSNVYINDHDIYIFPHCDTDEEQITSISKKIGKNKM